jgi:hypothetical protein
MSKHCMRRTSPRRAIGNPASLLLASLELLRLGAADGVDSTDGRVGAARRVEVDFFWIASKKKLRRSSEEIGEVGTTLSPMGSSWAVGAPA